MKSVIAEKVDLHGLRPMPGKCFVALKSPLQEYGNIIIPEAFRKRRSSTGTVVAASVREGRDIDGLLGREVMMVPWGGLQVDWRWTWQGKERTEIGVYPCQEEYILAVLYDGVWVDMPTLAGHGTKESCSGKYEPQRCPRCKAKDAPYNILLANDGICPVCKRYPDGRRQVKYTYQTAEGKLTLPNEVRIGEEDRVVFGGKKLKARGTVFSLPRATDAKWSLVREGDKLRFTNSLVNAKKPGRKT